MPREYTLERDRSAHDRRRREAQFRAQLVGDTVQASADQNVADVEQQLLLDGLGHVCTVSEQIGKLLTALLAENHEHFAIHGAVEGLTYSRDLSVPGEIGREALGNPGSLHDADARHRK